MCDIKIVVAHTPNRKAMRISHNPLLYHVMAGSDFLTEELSEGIYPDNQGENISSLHKSYCELTAQYWAWKNMEADYYGFCRFNRFFSFSRREITESEQGTIEYDFLNAHAIQEMHFYEKDMRDYIEKYDFLIAKGIGIRKMHADSVYNHWEIQPELRIRDADLFLDIIWEKYYDMYDTAKSFFAGDILYPCNMFIMKKEIFREYAAVLFDILDEFNRRADMKLYSREGYRTPAYLGERFAGIYYMYLQKQGSYRLGELQTAQIRNTDEQDQIPAKVQRGSMQKDMVPIVLAANQKYVPVLYTCIQSLTDHFSKSRNYSVCIFHTDIRKDCRDVIIKNFSADNVTVFFMNVSERVSGYVLPGYDHLTAETYYRFLILDIFRDYEKVVYLDCDMIICHDCAQLYDTDMGNNLIAASKDPDFIGQCSKGNTDTLQYCKDVLKLDNPYGYFQAGVAVFNVKELNAFISVDKLFAIADSSVTYRYCDQDIFNSICSGRIQYIDMKWNVLADCNGSRWKDSIRYAPHDILDAYEQARRDPYIIHYAGFLKPWMKPDEDFADRFWKVARRTVYYEQLLCSVQEYAWNSFYSNAYSAGLAGVQADHQPSDETVSQAQTSSDHRMLEALRKVARHFFPKNTRMRAWAIQVYCRLTGR